MHEASMHERNCFITLTYDDQHLPPYNSLQYSHFQGFMKRLRFENPGVSIRYFVAGEYGEKLSRPHFHACLFGYDFSFLDCPPISRTSAGNVIYQSPVLDRLWGKGFCSIGELNFQSAAYTARYVMKKVTGSNAKFHYAAVDSDSGEVHQRTPEFCKMSLKPGIGAGWFSKYSSDVFNDDHVVINGFPSKPPRYYDVLLKRISPDVLEDNKYGREIEGRKRYLDNTAERLIVREVVAKARLAFKKRVL
ncbi:MAG: replication initiator protein [Microviridae sp.]|nr:MAG: replication initiator protein [Microviridae sp.]